MAFNCSGWKKKSFHEQLSNENQSAEAPTSKLGFITNEQAVVVSSLLVVSRTSELCDGCQTLVKVAKFCRTFTLL